MTLALAVRGLTAGYGDEAILHDVSVGFEAGSVTTIVGSNGAGKSTLLKACYGLLRQAGGTVELSGKPLEGLAPPRRLTLGLAFVPQGRCNFPLMSVRENLLLGCYGLPRGLSRERMDEILALFPVLAQKSSVSAGNLSGGEQQILEMAMVMLRRPTVLMLDEPSIGLSPKNVALVLGVVQDIRRTGATVIIVEQNVKGALAISDRAIVMHLGQVIAEDKASAIMNDPVIARAYLGAPATT